MIQKLRDKLILKLSVLQLTVERYLKKEWDKLEGRLKASSVRIKILTVSRKIMPYCSCRMVAQILENVKPNVFI